MVQARVQTRPKSYSIKALDNYGEEKTAFTIFFPKGRKLSMPKVKFHKDSFASVGKFSAFSSAMKLAIKNIADKMKEDKNANFFVENAILFSGIEQSNSNEEQNDAEQLKALNAHDRFYTVLSILNEVQNAFRMYQNEGKIQDGIFLAASSVKYLKKMGFTENQIKDFLKVAIKDQNLGERFKLQMTLYEKKDSPANLLAIKLALGSKAKESKIFKDLAESCEQTLKNKNTE